MGGAAHAATDDMKPYLEGSYAWPKMETSGFSATAGVGIVRAGINFDRFVALEAFGAFGTSDANGGVYGIPVSLKLNSAYGAYIKGQYPVAPHFELFVRAGWLHASVEVTDKYYGLSGSSSDSSFSYGGGVQVPFGNGWYAQGDYMSYYSKNSDSIRGLSVGLGYRF